MDKTIKQLKNVMAVAKKSGTDVFTTTKVLKAAKAQADTATEATAKKAKKDVVEAIQSQVKLKQTTALVEQRNFLQKFAAASVKLVPAASKSLLKTCKGNKKTCMASLTALGIGSYAAGKAIKIFNNTDGATCNINSLTQSYDGNILIEYTISPESTREKKINQFLPNCTISITTSNSNPSLVNLTQNYTILLATEDGLSGTLIVHAPLMCTVYKSCETNNYVCAPDQVSDNNIYFDTALYACGKQNTESCGENPTLVGTCADKLVTSTKILQDGTQGSFVYNADDTGAIVLAASMETAGDAGEILGDGVCLLIGGLKYNCDTIPTGAATAGLVVVGIIVFLFFMWLFFKKT
jgi:hypothetical protein